MHIKTHVIEFLSFFDPVRTESKCKDDYTGRGREPNAETDKSFTFAFLLARGKSAKVLGQTLGP